MSRLLTSPERGYRMGCEGMAMREIIAIVPGALYLLVGLVSLVMAYKNIFSKGLLPFQEKAAGISWDAIAPSFRAVVIALMRVSGLGFAVVGLLLITSSVLGYFAPHPLTRHTVPLISLFYCAGLFLVNYSLHRKTKAATPWKGSLYAALAILAGIAISCLAP